MPKQRRRGPGTPGAWAASGTTNRFSSRSRPALPAEIPGGFSSSLLPPSFPRGRSATFFFAPRCPAPGGRTGPKAPPMKRIAVIGSGIAGLAAARGLARARPGHALRSGRPFRRPRPHGRRLARRPDPRRRHRLHRLQRSAPSPQLAALLAELGVATAPAEMSFSAQVPTAGIEWSSAGLAGVFAQPATCCARRSGTCSARCRASIATRRRWPAAAADVGARRFGRRLPRRAPLLEGLSRLVPPAAARLHLVVPDRADAAHAGRGDGALLPRPRPAAARCAGRAWRSVRGGADVYVAAHARLARRRPPGDAGAARPAAADRRRRRLDRPPAPSASTPSSSPATASMRSPSSPTRAPTSARCSAPSTTSATAPSCTPTLACCRCARRPGRPGTTRPGATPATTTAAVCVHCLVNRLQPLPFEVPVIVSLNPIQEPAAASVQGEFHYAHPSSTGARSPPRSACRRCRAAPTPGSAAPGPASAPTRTAWRRPSPSAPRLAPRL